LSLVEFDKLNLGLNEQGTRKSPRRILENGKLTALNIYFYKVDRLFRQYHQAASFPLDVFGHHAGHPSVENYESMESSSQRRDGLWRTMDLNMLDAIVLTLVDGVRIIVPDSLFLISEGPAANGCMSYRVGLSE
jgi:hypothetical protein